MLADTLFVILNAHSVILNEVKDLSGSTTIHGHGSLEILRYTQDDKKMIG